MDIANIVNAILSDFESESSDSSDEEEFDGDHEINGIFLVFRYRQDRHCIQNFIEDVIPNYTEKEFVTQFRIGTNVCYQLIQQFEESEYYRSMFVTPGGRQPLSAEKHILTFLYFVGHEAAGYRAVNNIFDMSISTLYSVVNRVAEFICSLGSKIIKWPNHAEINITKAYFLQHKLIPNVVGSIDGSHVLLDKPKNDPDSYINRKGNFSIQMQGIVDHRKKFIDIYIGFPGSVHDARVFKNSSIYNRLEDLCEGGYILGDSAYPLLKSLLTPYKDNGHLNDQQKNFNRFHSSARIYVEHTFGILKQRFRQLYHLKLRNPRLIVQIIKSCCILHNIANLDELDLLEDEVEPVPLEDNDAGRNEEYHFEDTDDGRLIRNQVCEEIWNNRNE